MSDKPVTLEEYQEVSETFFPKYHYVAKELGEGCKTEDILKVMETLSALALKKRADEKKLSIGFNKESND